MLIVSEHLNNGLCLAISNPLISHHMPPTDYTAINTVYSTGQRNNSETTDY